MKHSLLSVLFAFVLFTPVTQAASDVCTTDYSPVCGAHPVQCIKAPCYPVYQTYSNACMMERESASFIHSGTCTSEENGPVLPVEAYTPPKNCTAWFDGCNSCSRGPKGTAMCTLRACQIGSEKPGYCTAYEEPAPVVTPPKGGTGVVHPTPPVTEATTTTESTPPPGFLERLWNWFLHWFR